MPFYDLDSNFTLNAVGDLNIVTDEDAVNQALKNLLMTPAGFRPGEVSDNPTYGIGVREFLFDKVNQLDANTIRDTIVEKIARYERRVTVSDIVVTPLPETNEYEIEVYYILNSGTRDIQEFKTILTNI
jgi:phage baseplate assembly protein W